MSTVFTRARLAVAAFAVAVVAAGGVAGAAGSKPSSTSFDLFPNVPFQSCLAAPGKTPVAKVEVDRGKLNDQLELHVRNLKPDLDFDLFTVEKTPQLADGSPNPAFGGNFGFAWYQSDLHTNHNGAGEVTIKTILLDQIFGFDASRGVPPVNTFNVGFWFNNPADAASCGFTGVTPFNGEHTAGPLAMISRLDARTNLGPLCTDPQSAGNGTFTCNP
jgi:hypothetical protein